MKQPLPSELKRLTRGYEFTPVTIGHSDASVFKLEQTSQPDLFLKIQNLASLESLTSDALKLEWLSKHDILVPEVVLYLQEDNTEYLLTSAIVGHDASSLREKSEIPTVLEVLAENLKKLHALKITDCPFNQNLELKIAQAKHRLLENLVDETDFDDDRLGKTAFEVFQELLEIRPISEDLVFTHGDCCLPNIMIHNLGFAGFIDLGRAGIADRYQDLALLTRSLESDLNPQFNGWSTYFLERYGIVKPKKSKLEFYRLLDEFF